MFASITLVATLASTRSASAQVPGALASHLSLSHDGQDMTTHLLHRYDVSVELRIEHASVATLEVRGTVTSRMVDLMPGGSANATPERTDSIDERWTGHAVFARDALTVRFERTDAYRPPVAVDVEWRCSAHVQPVSGRPTRIWLCATSQSLTRSTGAGYPLIAYMQVPMYLAEASVGLSVDASARGGADHRSQLTSATLARR